MSTENLATQLTGDLKTGDSAAAAELLPLVYDYLYELAAHHFRQQRRDRHPQPAGLALDLGGVPVT